MTVDDVRILVVDDEPAALESLASSLAFEDYEVVTAIDGVSAPDEIDGVPAPDEIDGVSAPDEPVGALGGERFRAALAVMMLAEPAPQLLMPDEPTNNLWTGPAPTSPSSTCSCRAWRA